MASSSSRASSSSTSAGSTVATSSSSCPSTGPLPLLSLFTTKGIYLDLFQKIDYCDLDDLKKVNKTIYSKYQTLPPPQEARMISQAANCAHPDLVHTYFRKLYRFLNPKHLTAPWAQFYLARMHIEGLGVKSDVAKGLQCLASVPKDEKYQANLYYLQHFGNLTSHIPPFTLEILAEELCEEFKKENEVESKLEAAPKDTKKLAEIADAIGTVYQKRGNSVENRLWVERAFSLAPTLQRAKELIAVLKEQFKRLPSDKRKSDIQDELKGITSLLPPLAQVFIKFADSTTPLTPEEQMLLSQDGEGALELGLKHFDPSKSPTSPRNQLAETYFQRAIRSSCMLVEERKMQCYSNAGYWMTNTAKHEEMEKLLMTGFRRTQSTIHLYNLANLYIYKNSYLDHPLHAWIILKHALSNHAYKGASVTCIKGEANIWIQCAKVFFEALGGIDMISGAVIPPNLTRARRLLNTIAADAFESFVVVGQKEGWFTPLHQKILNEIMTVEVKVEEKSSSSYSMTGRRK